MGRNQPAQAMEELRLVAPYELGFCAILAPLYLRAQSFFLQGSPAEAAEEYQRIIDHRGSEPFLPFHAVAPLGLARAQAMAGNVAASREAYKRFLANWSDADSEIPVLTQAQEEYKRLTSGMVSRGLH